MQGSHASASMCASAIAFRSIPRQSGRHCSPSSRDEKQIEILKAAPRAKLTERTITDLNALLKRFEAVRRRGYAVSDQENIAGLCVLAAPVKDIDDMPIAAISVAAPTMRVSASELEKAGAVPLLNAAKLLSRAMEAAGSVSTAPQTQVV